MVILINEDYREYFAYLDELRESGITNMFGARPYIANAFGLEDKEAKTVLTDWMKCFSARSGDELEYVDFDKLGNVPTEMVDRLGTEVRP